MQYKGASCTPLRDLQFALGVAPGLRPLLAKVPAAGSNTILVSHGFNLRAISGFGPADGEAVVYQPDAKGGFNLVARVLVANWGALAQ